MTREFIWPFPGAQGFAFAPAWLPADYIGPRLDCPLPVRADDSPYAGKLDAWAPVPRTEITEAIEDFGGLPVWGSTSIGPAPVNTPLPGPPGVPVVVFPGAPPCCDFWTPDRPETPGVIVTPPDPETPAQVPLPGALGFMIGIVCLLIIGALFRHSHDLETIR